MIKIQNSSLQKKLFTYGIVPVVFLSLMDASSLHAEDQKKGSLVILESRPQIKFHQGNNLLQKVQTLTAHATEQAEKIRNLKEEIQSLKSKLHLLQLHAFSEKNDYKHLYLSLKQESAQNNLTRNNLERIILDLKNENQSEKLKNSKVEATISSLVANLSEQTTAIEKMEQNYKSDQFPHSSESAEQNLHLALRQEVTHYKETQQQLHELIDQLKKENGEEKQRLADVESYNQSLQAALKEQKKTLETLEGDHKNQLENLSTSSRKELNQYKSLYANLEKEHLENKETQTQLESLISHLQSENEINQRLIENAEIRFAKLHQFIDGNPIPEAAKKNNEILSEEDSGQFNLLYAALENELSHNKDTKTHLEQLVTILQTEKEVDKDKISDAEAQIHSLILSLLAKTDDLERHQEEHQKKAEAKVAQQETHSDKLLHAVLDIDITQAKEAKSQIDQLVDELQAAHKADKQKILEAEAEITTLLSKVENAHLSKQQEQEVLTKQLLEHQNTIANYEKELSQQKTSLSQLNEELSKQLVSNNDQKESESQLSQLADNATQEIIAKLQIELQQSKESLSLLEKQHSEQIQQLQEKQNADHTTLIEGSTNLLAQLYSTIEDQNSVNYIASQSNPETQKILAEILLEKEKSQALQKNLDEVQQIYDQTIKLYNEVYFDHNTAQKTVEKIQREFDERKSIHLVEIDALEVKLEHLAQELDVEKNKVQDLQKQLTAAEEEHKAFTSLSNSHQEITQNHQNLIDALSHQDYILSQALNEIDHQKKIVEEQTTILQNTYSDHQKLKAQMDAISFTNEEAQEIVERNSTLHHEVNAFKNSYYQHLLAFLNQEDQLQSLLSEFKKYQSDSSKKQKEHSQTQDVHLALLNEKSEEIRLLKEKITESEASIKSQLQGFATKIENDKLRQDELQKEIAQHQERHQSYTHAISENQIEINSLKEALSLKDEKSIQVAHEIESLTSQLQELTLQNSLLSKQLETISNNQERIQATNDQQKQAYIVQLEDSITDLKNVLTSKEKMIDEKENLAQSLLHQRNQFEEKLFLALKEKEGLESHQQLSFTTEQEMRSNLEKTQQDLTKYKTVLNELQKNSKDTEILSKLETTLEENKKLSQQIIEIQKIREQDQAILQNLDKARQSENEHIVKAQLALAENQKFVEQINALKLKIEEYEKQPNSHSQNIIVQMERLQEALQQTMTDKVALQSQFQGQLVTERVLTEKLEETIAELEQQRSLREKLEKSYDELSQEIETYHILNK